MSTHGCICQSLNSHSPYPPQGYKYASSLCFFSLLLFSLCSSVSLSLLPLSPCPKATSPAEIKTSRVAHFLCGSLLVWLIYYFWHFRDSCHSKTACLELSMFSKRCVSKSGSVSAQLQRTVEMSHWKCRGLSWSPCHSMRCPCMLSQFPFFPSLSTVCKGTF